MVVVNVYFFILFILNVYIKLRGEEVEDEQ